MFIQQNRKLGYQLTSLAISHLAPLITYFAIRSYVASDTEALAFAWFIPVAWTLGSSLWLRRLDVFALPGVVVYGIALTIAIFFNAGPLPLKLHHAIVGGAAGLVFLISVAIGKPFFLVFIRRSAKSTGYTEQVETAIADPKIVKRITNLTLLVGIVCLADAVLQTVLALTLSTSAFLVATTAIHIAAVVGIVLGVLLFFWVRSHR